MGYIETQNRFNLYFQKFILIFTLSENPLVLFMDDLQWADNASLKLIERLAESSESRFLFIVGAYRPSEIGPFHPLDSTLKRIKKNGLPVSTVSLLPFNVEMVSEIIQDIFSLNRSDVIAPAKVIFKKTGGNPFFIYQFLKTIYEEKLVTYDYNKKIWYWKLEEVERVPNTDNVVDFMINKIKKLPEQTQEFLKLASCIGARVSLKHLATILEKTSAEVGELANRALQEELLLPVGEHYKFVDNYEDENDFSNNEKINVSYKFQHDRIQQAVYSMLSEKEKELIHLKVGRLLLENVGETRLDEEIFDITNHLNLAKNLIIEPEARVQLARLNLRAGRKARKSIAYNYAIEYLKAGKRLLKEIPEERSIGILFFKLVLTLAECEHLAGNPRRAEIYFDASLKLSKDRDQKALVYEKKLHYYANMERFREAYQIGREALRLYGLKIPGNFQPVLFLLDWLKVAWSLQGKRIGELIFLPDCQDKDAQKQITLLAAVFKSAYQISPELCTAVALKTIQLNLKYGHIGASANSYLAFGGIFLGGILGRQRVGYEFGRLALGVL